MLRKTHSQPPAASHQKSSSSSNSNSSDKDAKSRCKSIPGSALGDKKDVDRKTSVTGKDSGEKSKLENKKPSTGAVGGASSGSPKPKRTIFEGFRNTLRPKSKSQDGSSSSKISNVAGENYATVPDVVQDTGATGDQQKKANKQPSSESNEDVAPAATSAPVSS